MSFLGKEYFRLSEGKSTFLVVLTLSKYTMLHVIVNTVAQKFSTHGARSSQLYIKDHSHTVTVHLHHEHRSFMMIIWDLELVSFYNYFTWLG